MKKQKLKLNRETVRHLQKEEISVARGGDSYDCWSVIQCPDNKIYTCNPESACW